jgi:CBS domain-containing protein
MATNDPKSRLNEGALNSPSYPSPNGVTEQPASLKTTAGASTSATQPDVERRAEETPGEKIGRFFRHAMERLSGHHEDEWRRGNERNERDRDTQDRYRSGDRSWQYGRSALRDQNEWRDLGRSRDDRKLSYRGGPSDETGGIYERLQGGTGGGGYGQGRSGGQGSYASQARSGGQGGYGQGAYGGQSGYERDENRAGPGQAPSFENRSEQSAGQRALGKSPGESYGLSEVPDDRRPGSDRGSGADPRRGEQLRDDWSQRDWARNDPYRDRWAAERSAQGGPTGMTAGHPATGASYGFGQDEERVADAGETDRDRDRGQGRRFWQREPLAARDVMTRNPKTVSRQSAHREAAAIMRDENCGVLPVVDSAGRLEGILTDRDIVVRGVAHDRAVELRIEDVMTDDVSAVTEDEPLTSVLDLMGRKQIRRVPVVDRDDRLLGIISMADIANRADYDEDLQDAFERISSRRSFWSLFS